MAIEEQHPSLESLAAFTEGRTGGEERERIVRHLSGCRECYTLVAETGSYLQQEQESVVRPMPPRAIAQSWWLAAAAGLLLVAALGFFARTHRRDRFSEIASAASTSHPLHVRLSGGVLPGEGVLRGSSESNERLLLVYLELKAEKQKHPSAQNLHAFGLTALLLGRTDEAIDALQSAAKQSNDAAMWSDLAAAHEYNWESTSSATDLDQADALSKRAMTLDPNRAETLFNRAQVLEAEGNRTEAIALWKRYVAADAYSAWAPLARRHLQELSAPSSSEGWTREKQKLRGANRSQEDVRSIVDRYPQECRTLVEEELLPEWASQLLHAELAAAGTLGTARAISVELDRRGDALPLETIRGLTAASPDATLRMANGIVAFANGRRATKKGEYDAAARELRRAEALLAAEHSPFSIRALIGLASNDCYYPDYPAALAIVHGARRVNENLDGFAAAAAKLDWLEGLCLSAAGQMAEGVQRYRQSATRFKRLGESENEASVRALLAEVLDDSGDAAGAEEQRRIAIVKLTRLGDAFHLPMILEEAAGAALHRGNLHQARSLYERMRAASGRGDNPNGYIYASIGVAEILKREGNVAMARDAIESAAKRLEQISDSREHARLSAELAVARTRVEGSSNFEAYDRLVATLRSEGNHGRVSALLLEKGERQAAAQQPRQADETLRAALAELQLVRKSVDERVMQARYLETGSRIVDALVLSLTGQQRPMDALLILQGVNAYDGSSSASDQGSGSAPRVSSEALLTAVPAHVVVLQYKVIGERLMAWVVGRGQLSFVQSRIDAAALRSTADALREAALRGEVDQYDRSAARLYSMLLAPVRTQIAGFETTIIVPDSETATIPFAALRPSNRLPFLMETTAVAYAPSIGALAAAGKRSGGSLQLAAVFGNPVIDVALYPGLQPLPGALREAADIAGLYPHATVQMGAQATKQALLQALNSTDVVHVAAHAIPNAKVPYLSSMILSPGGGDNGILTAGEIAQTHIHSRVVVLSGCSTANGPRLRAEGMTGLASAFLTGGAQQVLATCWPISDRSATSLMTEFHRGMLANENGAAALQRAQQTLLRQAGTPTEKLGWIPYQLLIGAKSVIEGRS